MPKTSSRPAAPVDVTLSSPAEPERPVRLPRLPYLPWAAAAIVGAVAVVLLGWVVTGAVVAAGWLTMPQVPPAMVLDVIGQLWLGAHGVPFTLGELSLALAPLGVSALLAVALAAVARYALNQTDDDGRATLRMAGLVTATCTGAYALGCWLLASLVGAPPQALAAFVGALVIGGLGSAVGALRAARVDLFARLPRWTRGVPEGALAGLAGLALAAAATLAVALASHSKQVGALAGGLQPDAVGSALLVVLHLAYLPNLLLWAGAYALGSGFTVGAGTLVTPAVSQLGLLPAIPVAGALPAVPPPYPEVFWLVAPATGVLAALAFCHRLWRADRTLPALTAAGGSGLAAALAGGLWAAASWVSRGDLGAERLVGLGPGFPELLSALLPMVGAALAVGLGLALWVARRRPAPRGPDGAAAGASGDEETLPVHVPFGLDADADADVVANAEAEAETRPLRFRTPFGLD